jgi:ribose transport system substrate-binding protein
MRLIETTLLASAMALGPGAALAEGIDDPTRGPYYSAFEGKTVAYVPVAMGFDLTEGWAAGLREALEPLGIKFEIRDPNWSTDAGAQAITSLISEKPDVLVVHNPDVQSMPACSRRLRTPASTSCRSTCARATPPTRSSAPIMSAWARGLRKD